LAVQEPEIARAGREVGFAENIEQMIEAVRQRAAQR
jgi:hypothetical protein